MDRNILILEDNEDRMRKFERAATLLGAFCLHFWRDAKRMIMECPPLLTNCSLISLDHDLNSESGAIEDPGTGLEVSEFLARRKPICPIIIHTSNTERRWSMHNEFRFGEWVIEIVPPIGENWIQNSWLPKAKMLIESHPANTSTLKTRQY
ncbi:MAG TPA: cyclic-phosphate processing receiver domain-containing protein [Verrucomicrobiae bacterium]|nr:cyclic-phosphate processing receiver domain-containing protein [Verrucomicrobiae bacterium]